MHCIFIWKTTPQYHPPALKYFEIKATETLIITLFIKYT